MVASLRTHWEFPFPLWEDPVLSCWVMRTMGKKLHSSCFPSSSYTLRSCSFFKTGTKLIYFVILYSPLSNSQSHCICIVLFLPCKFREFFFVRLSFFITYKKTALHRSLERHYMTFTLCQRRAHNSHGSAKILKRSKNPQRIYYATMHSGREQ